MSDAEKELRRFIAERTYNEAQEAVGMSLLDALLAEHRAEVEALRGELRRANQSWASARAEALEMVAVEADRRASLARRVYVGTEKAPVGEGAGDALETLAASIRAEIAAAAAGHNGAPSDTGAPGPFDMAPIRRITREEAEAIFHGTTPVPVTIPVERVREEMPRFFPGILPAQVEDFLRRLGVDLDAKGEDEAAISRGEHQQAYWTGSDKTWPSACGGCPHRIHAPGYCVEAGDGRGGGCDCRWAP